MSEQKRFDAMALKLAKGGVVQIVAIAETTDPSMGATAGKPTTFLRFKQAKKGWNVATAGLHWCTYEELQRWWLEWHERSGKMLKGKTNRYLFIKQVS